MTALPSHILSPNPNIYLGDRYGTIDVETTNHDKGSALRSDNQLILSCLKGRGERTSSYWGNEYQAGPVVEKLGDFAFIIAHNAKFELQWLKRCGLDLSKVVVWDTQIAEYVLRGNRGGKLTLDSLAEQYGIGSKGAVVSKLIKGGVPTEDIPQKWLERYCIQDVNLTEQIFHKQLEICTAEGLLPVVYTRCLFTPVLADIEENGMTLDCERVREAHEEYTQAFHKCNALLESFAGGINWNSPKQVTEFLYDELKFKEARDWRGNVIKTATGARSASIDTLNKLRATNKRQRAFLALYKERNQLNTILSKNLDFFWGVCKEKGGIFQANFNQTVTQTHRLSSSGRKLSFEMFEKDKSVQFQNFARKFKPLFTARKEGWNVQETDGAQLEFRVAAFLGQDVQAATDIRNGSDVHAFTANVLTTAGQPTDRQNAKAHTFKPLYGGSSGTKAEQEYYSAFKEKYPGITGAQQRWIDEVVVSKQLTTVTGFKFYWPDTTIQRSGYVTNTTSICNYPVQSFATADIIPIAVTYQWHRMKAQGLESFLVNTIHDSSIAEINPNEGELCEEIAVKAYTTDVYSYLDQVFGIDFNIQLGVGIKVSKNWGEGEEKKVTVEPTNPL